MALAHSPKIVTDGLVFAYDMANSKKSWKGRPVTNQFTLPTSDTNGFGVQSSTFTRVRTGNYGGYEIQPTDYVWRYNISGNDCPYHGWDIPTNAGAVVTFSFDYYVDATTTNYPITNQLANMENTGSGVGGGYSDPTPSIKGVWKKGYFSSTATATGNSRCLLYPGSCGSRLADSGFILYKNPQVEFDAPGSVPTPFVAGTRSNTQALLDLTGNNTITANSLTYNSNGSFSFNGSTNYLQVPYSSLLSPTSAITLSVWATTDWQTTNNVRLLSKTESGGWQLSINDDPAGNRVGMTIHVGGTYRYCTVLKTSIVSGYHNLVGTCDGRYLYLYIDGIQVSSLDLGSTMALTYSNNNDLIIGAEAGASGPAGSNYITASINDVKIYNRALSAAEVKQNFNALRGRYGI